MLNISLIHYYSVFYYDYHDKIFKFGIGVPDSLLISHMTLILSFIIRSLKWILIL